MASIRDVAKAAGVSLGTVSNAINRPEVLAPLTLRKVQKVIEDMGFVPNASARNLRAGRNRVIGLIVPDISNPFFTALAMGVNDAAFAAKYVVILCNTDESTDKESQYLEVLSAQNVEGILITPARETIRALAKVAEKGIIGENYNIGSGTVLNNIQITKKILLNFEKINYNKNLREEVNTKKAYFFMFIISMIGCLCTLLFENLHQIILFIFSISAGVAPIFILRWIWRKINGWSQLSAMFSSAFYTLIFTFIFQNQQQVMGLSFASARLTFVTLLTSATWLLITLISPNQILKEAFEPIRLTSLKPFLAALLLGALFLSLFVASVYFLVQF